VFGRRGQATGGAQRSSRYVVQELFADVQARNGRERSRKELEDALNYGEDNGWELINVYGVGTTFVLMVVWDTEPK